MKVKELIEELLKLPQQADVILQGDSEGNYYSNLAGVDPDCIIIESEYDDAAVYSTDWSAEDADMTEKEWKKALKKPRVVVLFPGNRV